MEIVSNVALISINETLFVQLISFLIFLFVINRVMFRPLRRVMNERDTYLASIENELSDAAIELDKINNRILAQETEVMEAAHKIKAEIEANGTTKAVEIFNSTRNEIDTLRKNTEKEVADMLTKAREHILTESENLSVSIMEKVLNRRLIS